MAHHFDLKVGNQTYTVIAALKGGTADQQEACLTAFGEALAQSHNIHVQKTYQDDTPADVVSTHQYCAGAFRSSDFHAGIMSVLVITPSQMPPPPLYEIVVRHLYSAVLRCTK